MKLIIMVAIGMNLSLAAYAKEDGFYVNGVSASTARGAQLLVDELEVSDGDHNVCYEGYYESAVSNVHPSISIAIMDVYGESEYPSLDAEVFDAEGKSVASGIISACN